LSTAGSASAGVVAHLVEALEFLERVAGECGVVELAFVGPDQLAELRAPVADVVVANDAGAAEGEQPADRLADHGRTQMADVHLLRGVGRTVIDDPGLAALGRSSGGAGGERLAAGVGDQPGLERGGLGGEIDETRSGDRHVEGRFDVDGQGGHQLLGQGAWILLPALGVGENAVGLKVAVTRVGGAHLTNGRLPKPLEWVILTRQVDWKSVTVISYGSAV
jgi:hypothetical protein